MQYVSVPSTNVVLLIHAAHLEESYKDLLSLAVCCVDNRDCMLQHCTRCPGFGTVLQLLQSKFEDLDEIISFKQWVSVDRTDLITQSLPVSEFIQLLIRKLEDLTPHHYTFHILNQCT